MSTTEYIGQVTYYGETINLTEEHFSYLMKCVRNGETIEQAMDRIRIEVDEGIPIVEAARKARQSPDPTKLDYFIYVYRIPLS
jgi:hypothetical protein